VPAHSVGHRDYDLSLTSAVRSYGEERIFVASAHTTNVRGRPDVHQSRRKGYCMAPLATLHRKCRHVEEANAIKL
jgi:hypothetical protein